MQFEMSLQSAMGVTTGPVVTRNQRRWGGSAATQNFPGELADPDGHQRLGLGKQSGLGPGRSRTGPATGISIGPAGRPITGLSGPPTAAAVLLGPLCCRAHSGYTADHGPAGGAYSESV